MHWNAWTWALLMVLVQRMLRCSLDAEE